MKPGYTTTQSKYGNALNANSGATPKVYIGERKGTNSIQMYKIKDCPKNKKAKCINCGKEYKV